MLSQKFVAFLNEATFTKELLGAGATQIRKANYANKGQYFQSFSNLSIGLERIGKLCLVLDYALSNNGKLPEPAFLRTLGHDLVGIYKQTTEVIRARSLEFHFLNSLDAYEHRTILSILSGFAKGDRYSNLSQLTGERVTSPLGVWFEKIDKYIFQEYISEQKKRTILLNAEMVSSLAESFSSIYFLLEDESPIRTVRDASYWTGFAEAVAPYRQLFVVQTIRYWVEVLNGLEAQAREIVDLPHFLEIYALFFNPDSYIRTRKTWVTLR